MSLIQSTMLPAPEVLKNDVECFRIATYSGAEALTIHVSPGGIPGLVFQANDGHAALASISMHAGHTASPPPLFLYGAGAEPSVMRYKSGTATTIQVIFKPHALNTLLGINASELTNGWTDLHAFSREDLNLQLLEASDAQERITLLTRFLLDRFEQAHTRDRLVEESLRLIHQNIHSITVKALLVSLSLSERQFERRFARTVGLSPLVYIRVKRFQEAIRLIKTRQFARLTDVASALHFSDQSHFIREIKAFSGLTPSCLAQQDNDIYHEQTGYASL